MSGLHVTIHFDDTTFVMSTRDVRHLPRRTSSTCFLPSSLHLIGEIFDRVYPECAMGSAVNTNVQTTLVPAGGATIVDRRSRRLHLQRTIGGVVH